MNVFVNAYVAASIVMFLLHRWLARYRRRHGETAAWHRWHDTLHNVGHLLRIGLVVLVVYLLIKSAGRTLPPGPTAQSIHGRNANTHADCRSQRPCPAIKTMSSLILLPNPKTLARGTR